MASEVPAVPPEAPEAQVTTVDPSPGVLELVQPPQTELGVDVPKPARAAPKVFASPKKNNGKQAHGNQAGAKQSLRSKLRKALAPYLTSTYLKGEMAKRFTQEFLDTHPLPDNEDDMPAYVQLHMHELNRVTARWTGTVGKALDPDLHRLAVEDRLKRLREKEEGRLGRKDAPGGRQAPHRSQAGEPAESAPLHVDGGYGEADVGLSTEQLFGAVQLVSDVQVWQQILAAQRAEERRQHAIAELHLHHAARIIQRSWHSFMAHKKQEQARLDALVSPDVQAMLSAAAYKAMRDARTRLTIQKLRKSLSRKARGFGSTLPRDLEPISRRGSQLPPSRGLTDRRSRTGLPDRGSNTSGIGQTGGDWDEEEEEGGMRVTISTGDGSVEEGPRRTGRGVSFRTDPAAVAKAQSFAFRSAQIVQRMVSIKEVNRGEDGSEYLWSAFRRKAPAGGDAGEESSEDEEDEDTEDDDDDDDDEDDAEEEGDEDEDDDSEDEEVGTALEPESAEAAIAEAEEVVAVAAELARSFMRRDSGTAAAGIDAAVLTPGGPDGGGGEEDSDYDDDYDDGARVELDEEALQLLNSVEAAAEAAASGRPYTPPAEALAAAASSGPRPPARGTDGGPHDHPSPRPPRVSGPSDTSLETGLLRQVIAGAFAAAAAPVLGRSNAMAMAELSLGNAALEATGGMGTETAAAAETGPGLGVAQGFPSRPRRKAGRLRPKPPAAGRIRDLGETQVTVPIGEGPRRTVPVTGTGQAQPGPLEIRSSTIATGVGSMGVAGAAAAQALRVRVVEGPGGVSDGKASERMMPSSWVQARNSEPGHIGVAAGGDAAAAAAGLGRQERSGSGGPLDSPLGRRMPRTSYGGGTAFLPYVVQPPSHVTTNSGEAAADAAGTYHGSGGGGTGGGQNDGDGSGHAAAGGGHNAGGGSHGGWADTSGGNLVLPPPSPRMSSTIISAAAAAAAATQPWASRRLHYHPPGSHTIAGALPDPRVGAPKDTAVREPSWLLPPIPSAVSRAATGPPCLGGGTVSGSVSPAATISPTGAAAVLAQIGRTSSDPNLQRPPGIGGGVVAAGARLTVQVAPQQHQQHVHHPEVFRSSKLPTTSGGLSSPHMPAATGPAAVRARRASVVGSSMTELQQYGYASIGGGGMMPGVLSQSIDGSFTGGGVQCGFHINGLHGGVAVSNNRLRPTRLTSEGGQTTPLLSALTGGGGGAGGGTAAARQAKHHMTYTRGL